ncbi:MAG: AAA family ATPase, partial [Acidobacteriota bacterium]
MSLESDASRGSDASVESLGSKESTESEKAEGFVYHKARLGPMPVIDYVEPDESRESRESRESLESQASHRSAPERAAFVARAAREWVAELEGTALPGRLLDDLWLEGEMAVCFGESGAGKSVLAVQAADAIASGVPLAIEDGRFDAEVDGVKRCGKKAPAEPRTVLYFDLALTKVQFGRRYIMEPDREDTEFSDYKYEFPDNFVRLQLDLAAETPGQYKTRAEYLLAEIETEIRKRDAKIVIIDSLDRMTEYGILRSREAAYIMSRLNLLRHELGLSVLVLAQLSRRSDASPLSATRLLTTRTISAFADSVFAIGICRGDERLRYLKHLGSRSTGIIYDSSYLPVLCLWPCETNFLSFQLNGFVDEAEMLDAYSDQQRHDRSDEVKEMAAEGWKQREIGVRLSMSLGSVNRALNIWSPYDDRPKPPPPPAPKPVRPTKRVKTVEQ